MAITQRQAANVVFGVGALLLIGGAAHWWLGERAFARMRDTTCTVVSRKIETNLLVSPGGRRRRPGGARYREEAHLVFAHTLGGQRQSFSEDFVYDWGRYSHAIYEEGKAYPCRYDPEDPENGTVRTEFDPNDSKTLLAFGLVTLLLGAAVPGIFRLAATNARLRRRASSARIFE